MEVVKYVIARPTSKVDFKSSKADVVVLCHDDGEPMTWKPANESKKIVIFDSKQLAEEFVRAHRLDCVVVAPLSKVV